LTLLVGRKEDIWAVRAVPRFHKVEENTERIPVSLGSPGK